MKRWLQLFFLICLFINSDSAISWNVSGRRKDIALRKLHNKSHKLISMEVRERRMESKDTATVGFYILVTLFGLR